MFKEALDNWLIPIQTHAKVIHPKYYKLIVKWILYLFAFGQIGPSG